MGTNQPTISAAPLPFAGRLRAFLLICGQLALLLLVVYCFEIEKRRHFFPVLCIAAGGFVVHAWLSARFRAVFFVLLSLGGILFVLGWAAGAKVIGIGLGLIALCHLPVPLLMRAVVLALAGACLAGLRLEYPVPFWKVLGSMFMFRLIVYVYEKRHERTRPPWSHVLAYFFPLPNVCFLFFPILDFKKFRATYYNEDDYRVYQTGIVRMVRGVTHLLAYRITIKAFHGRICRSRSILPSPESASQTELFEDLRKDFAS